jgi:flagellar operon protein
MTMDGLTRNTVNTANVNPTNPANIANPVNVNKPGSFHGNFKTVLETAIHKQSQEGVQFSKHANMRLNARQIELTADQLSRVEDGVNKADEKGIKDSLVLVDDVALVVNVKSKMVITAIASANQQENVFSNIDGAVIV